VRTAVFDRPRGLGEMQVKVLVLDSRKACADPSGAAPSSERWITESSKPLGGNPIIRTLCNVSFWIAPSMNSNSLKEKNKWSVPSHLVR
ncbi:MAG: hypothetical protein KAT23_09125, partial [Anaerolineales bacterium]|nr:hypothetical protein [Anaerolineales bacterium]